MDERTRPTWGLGPGTWGTWGPRALVNSKPAKPGSVSGLRWSEHVWVLDPSLDTGVFDKVCVEYLPRQLENALALFTSSSSPRTMGCAVFQGPAEKTGPPFRAKSPLSANLGHTRNVSKFSKLIWSSGIHPKGARVRTSSGV